MKSCIALALAVVGTFALAAETEPASAPASRPATSSPASRPAGLFQIIKDFKVGFIDQDGKVVIEPRFDLHARQWVDDFSEGMARFSINGKSGFIDTAGKQVIEPNFAFADNFHQGLAAVQAAGATGKFGFIDRKGKLVIEMKYGGAWHFADGVAPVWEAGSKFGLVNAKGELVLTPAVYQDIQPLHEGLAACKKDGKYGYLDKSGKEVIAPQFEAATDFHEGFAVAESNGKYGFIDRKGICPDGFKYAAAWSFSEGLAWVEADKEQVGYVDTKGKMVIKLPATAMGWTPFSEGVAAVLYRDKQGNINKWGYIDRTGKFVLQPKWFIAYPFHGGLAKVTLSVNPNGGIEKAGYIDHEGKYVYEPTE